MAKRLKPSENQSELIKKAVIYVGNQYILAELCEVNQSTVNRWISGGFTVTAVAALKIETATNGEVTRAELCPEVFKVSDIKP